jgi:two-component system sensor histidine kinase KdpD
MSHERPDPDQLLARVQADEYASRRGRLKVFFGYAAGVGKTYAMLQTARRDKAAGVEVVVGYVEPHGRSETEALLDEFEAIPCRNASYRGVTLREFDVDAALARKPQLILVDELAHTNAPESRHTRRWQDVEELLEAGIDVYTTLNVQHVESLNDIVSQITGVVVRETVPDVVLERAYDIELIDVTPDELLDRLKAGKVYIPQQASHALQNFFQKSNLVALRELSLRQAARRLSRDVDAARREKAGRVPWATNERLLVCIGPSPSSAKLIRTAKRMASAFNAEWLAVEVRPLGRDAAEAGDREKVAQHMRLAERLGAETHTLTGEDVAKTLIDFAESRNVTKIVVGKTERPFWRRLMRTAVADALVERSRSIDVQVIRVPRETPTPSRLDIRRPGASMANYVRAGTAVAVCSLLSWLSHHLQVAEANIDMLFLMGVVYAAVRCGRGPAIAAAVASVLIFDLFFVPPFLEFTVDDAQYIVTFMVMLAVGFVISTLTERTRDQLLATQKTERHTAALFRLTRQLSQVAGTEFLTQIAGRLLSEIFEGETVIFLREGGASLSLRYGHDTSVARRDSNAAVAHWVAEHEEVAGAGTDTLPDASAYFVPLVGSRSVLGAIGVSPDNPARLLDPEQRRLLATCASLIALSLERDQSVLEARDSTTSSHDGISHDEGT